MIDHPKDEHVDASRRQAARGLVHAIDDSGGDQVLTVETHAGVVRSQVPVHYPFGLASHCPADGAYTVVHAMAGDGGDPVALPPANPQAARFGKLPEGEAVLYDVAGNRVHIRDGQLVDIQAIAEVRVSVGGKLVLDVTAGTVAIHGNVTVTGDVVANGISLTQHVHGNVQPGSGETGAPQG